MENAEDGRCAVYMYGRGFLFRLSEFDIGCGGRFACHSASDRRMSPVRSEEQLFLNQKFGNGPFLRFPSFVLFDPVMISSA